MMCPVGYTVVGGWWEWFSQFTYLKWQPTSVLYGEQNFVWLLICLWVNCLCNWVNGFESSWVQHFLLLWQLCSYKQNNFVQGSSTGQVICTWGTNTFYIVPQKLLLWNSTTPISHDQILITVWWNKQSLCSLWQHSPRHVVGNQITLGYLTWSLVLWQQSEVFHYGDHLGVTYYGSSNCTMSVLDRQVGLWHRAPPPALLQSTLPPQIILYRFLSM